jgi:hypothetical protein
MKNPNTGAPKGSGDPTTQQESQPSQPYEPYQGAILRTPLVYSLKTRKRKKKYTSGTKGWQKLTLGLSDALWRSGNSVSRGARTFSKRSNKSARRRRDGLVRDSLRNASRGFANGLTELGEAPYEVARQIPTGQVRRAFQVLVPFSWGR